MGEIKETQTSGCRAAVEQNFKTQNGNGVTTEHSH